MSQPPQRRHPRLRFLPKLRLDFQFKHALNQATDVMRENLAKRLVDLRGLRFAPKESPNFALIIENVVSTFERLW